MGDSLATSEPIKQYHTAVLSNNEGETGVWLESASSSGRARFVLVAGEPLEQGVVQHGPFVMCTKGEIQQAFMDYQFERNVRRPFSFFLPLFSRFPPAVRGWITTESTYTIPCYESRDGPQGFEGAHGWRSEIGKRVRPVPFLSLSLSAAPGALPLTTLPIPPFQMTGA